MSENDFVLYLLLRKDMDSLNHTGKSIAQGMHAANHAAWAIGKGQFGTTVMAQFAAWEKQTPQGFGTTIVFGRVWDNPHRTYGRDHQISISDIRAAVEHALAFRFAAAIVTDPSYPLIDGKTSHAFPCETCGWIFGSKSDLAGFLSKFVLHSAALV